MRPTLRTFFLLFLVVPICLPTLVLAAEQDESAFFAPTFKEGFTYVKDTIRGEAQVNDFEGDPVKFITAGLKIVLAFVAILAVAVLIWGGIKYIISLGDEDSAAEAKKLILYAIIGLLIIGAAALVVNLVIGLFKI